MFLAAVLFAVMAAVATVVAVLLSRAGNGAGGGDDYDQRRRSSKAPTVVAVSLGAIAVLLAAVPAVVVIGPTDVGVPVSFGKVGQPLTSGLHVVAPWTTIESYPTRPVTVEVSGGQQIIARTSDAGQMRIEVAARWKVDPAKAKDLYLQVRTGDDDRISSEIVVKNLRQAVGEVYSRTNNLDAVNDRTKVTSEIAARLQAALDAYGITVEDINLRSVEPDEKTAASIAAFASQQQATRIAEEAKKTATSEAERRLIEAQGLKTASQALEGISPAQAAILCMQVWQQTVAKATDAGQSIYTTPCGGAAAAISVPAKP